MPKTKYNLPLYFNNKKYFQSKKITALSILIIGFIYWNAFQIYQNIGDFQNIKIEAVDF